MRLFIKGLYVFALFSCVFSQNTHAQHATEQKQDGKTHSHSAPARASTRHGAPRAVAILLPHVYTFGMRLSVIQTKRKSSPWLVVLPARLSPTGKRQYKRFTTRAAANDYITGIKQAVRRDGEKAMALLPSALAADAAAAAALLAGTGWSLHDAVQKLFALLQQKGVALWQAIPLGGQGAQQTTTPPPAPNALTLKAAMDLVIQAKAHQSRATLKGRQTTFNTLLRRSPQLADTAMETFTPDNIAAALDAAWPTAPNCWNVGRRHLHALFAYCIRRRLVHMENPVSPLDLRHVKEAEITALPPADLSKLFAACRPSTAEDIASAQHLSARLRYTATLDTSHLRAYIALCAFAGIRPTECQQVKWQDIDWEDNIISVRVANAKTGAQRHIELHPTLRAWLTFCRPPDAAENDYITPHNNLSALLSEIRRRAGFGGANTWQQDCLRHSYATYYLKAQVGNITQLQLNMGHRSVQLLYTRYTNMAGVTRATAESWWNLTPKALQL